MLFSWWVSSSIPRMCISCRNDNGFVALVMQDADRGVCLWLLGSSVDEGKVGHRWAKCSKNPEASCTPYQSVALSGCLTGWSPVPLVLCKPQVSAFRWATVWLHRGRSRRTRAPVRLFGDAAHRFARSAFCSLEFGDGCHSY